VADLTSYIGGPQGFDLSQITPEWVRDSGMKHDGKYYFMPRELGGDFLIYNKGLFTQASVPEPKTGWTTDDFLDTCKRLLAFMQRSSDGVERWATYTVPPGTFWSFGAESVGPDMKTIVGYYNSPQAAAFYQWELDLIQGHRVMISPAQLQALQMSQTAAVQVGRLAIATGGYADAKAGRVQFRNNGVEIGIVGEPRAPTGKAHHSMRLIMDTMSNQSKQPQAAWELLKYLAGPVGQEQRARALGQMPANDKARQAIGFYTDPDWKEVVELQKLPTGIIPAQRLLAGYEPVNTSLLVRMAEEGVRQVLDSEAARLQAALDEALRNVGR
jgi:multiple sugar transport system substrate-binding protein